MVKSLTNLHQTKHHALMDLRLKQEDRICLLAQGQEEDRLVIRSLQRTIWWHAQGSASPFRLFLSPAFLPLFLSLPLCLNLSTFRLLSNAPP